MSTGTEQVLEIDKISLDGIVYYIRDNSATKEIHMNGNTFISNEGVIDLGNVTTDISGKADKVPNATRGNFATLSSSGNLVDSGKKDSDFVHISGSETISGNKLFSQTTSFRNGVVLENNAVQHSDLSGFDWIVDKDNNTVQGALDFKENTSNKVTSISSVSTDNQYPTAKCMWDIIGDVETLINAL